MQLPHSWRSAWLLVWPQHRLLLYVSGSVLIAVSLWTVPTGRSWMIGQAEAFGILHPAGDVPLNSIPTPTPTADPLTQLQKSVDSLTASDTSETSARKQGQTQLQDTLVQLQALLTDLDRSSAELSRLVGTPATAAVGRPAPAPVPPLPTSRSQTSSIVVPVQNMVSPHQVVVSAKVSVGASVSLNSGSITQLESLPGIGPAYAQRIVAYRISHGGFKNIDELSSIKGIGSSRLAKLRSRVIL